MIRVELPYPAKALWPNGRAHHLAKAREVKKHRAWSDLATLEAVQIGAMAAGMAAWYGGNADGATSVKIVVHAKPKGPLPDRDNCVAAAKAYLDGIAQRLNINDCLFAAPTVEFDPVRSGRFVIEIGSVE